MAHFVARGRIREGRGGRPVRSLAARVGAIAATLATLATLTLGAHDAHAYAVKKTTHGELVHWDDRDVHYALSPSLDANVPGASNAARNAMDGWSGSVGAPDMHGDAADDSSPKQPGFDGKNGVFFMPGGYAPAGRALAITVLTYDNATGRILDADVIVNGSYSFAVLDAQGRRPASIATQAHPSSTDGISHDEPPAPSTDVVYDLYHVVAHEFGHSLGMNDELTRNDALMYRYSAPNDATMRAPAPDDISGLAELYSTSLDGHGNGCGGATVAPKKPSSSAQHAALFASLGLLLFLVARARNDRRARVGFVLATAAAAIVLLPSASKKESGIAHASEAAPGQARAHVLATSASFEGGLVKTTYKLATTVCRAAACPKLAKGVAWGGTTGNLRQEVGGQYAPNEGDDVDVSFVSTSSPLAQLAPLTNPLGATGGNAGATADDTAEVRVITPAQ